MENVDLPIGTAGMRICLRSAEYFDWATDFARRERSPGALAGYLRVT